MEKGETSGSVMQESQAMVMLDMVKVEALDMEMVVQLELPKDMVDMARIWVVMEENMVDTENRSLYIENRWEVTENR